MSTETELFSMEPPRLASFMFPEVIYYRAKYFPRKMFARIVDNSWEDVSDVTYSTMQRAIEELAIWIVDKLGAKGIDWETLAYIGVQDLRYFLLPIAAQRCGYKILSTSIRNGLTVNEKLCHDMECKVILYSEGADLAQVPSFLEKYQIPGLSSLLDSQEREPREHLVKTEDPLVVLHTSGSTGRPKPVVLTHGMFPAPILEMIKLPDRDGQQVTQKALSQASSIYIGFPLFHMMAFVLGLVTTCLYDQTLYLQPPNQAMDGKLLYRMLTETSVEAICSTPMAAEELVRLLEAEVPSGLPKLSRLKYFCVGGASLSTRTIQILHEFTKFIEIYASTETGASIVTHCASTTDQGYIHIDNTFNSIYWKPVGNMFEPVIQKVLDPADVIVSCRFQTIFELFPVSEWPMQDLFSMHPTKKNYYRLEGRADDIIIFKNGSNLNPIPLEALLAAHHLVIRNAVILGQGRRFPVLLVEPCPSPTVCFQQVWKLVKLHNLKAPSNGQIERSHIILTRKGTEMPKTAKGTVVRKEVAKMYETEIEAIYLQFELHSRDLNNRLP